MSKQEKIKIAISSCLLGKEVRFDGGHKRDRFITDRLSDFVSFVSVCPEVGIGMGVPRQPIRLVGHASSYRALGVTDPELDVTEQLIEFAHTTAAQLQNVCGYIFKSKSPSCGAFRVKLYPADSAMANRDGVGLYARTIMEQLPHLPVEEEGRLNDPRLRENFVERIFVYHRWQELVAKGLSAGRLVDFHTRHKMLVLAHGQKGYAALGNIVAGATGKSLTDSADKYISELMVTLKRPATRRSNTNVLQHIQGYLKKKLDTSDKKELSHAIEQYRLGFLPLIVPMTLLKHHFMRQPDEYIAKQIYLDPHPAELMLRNSL